MGGVSHAILGIIYYLDQGRIRTKMRTKERNVVVKVPPNVKPETMRDIERFMKGREYRIEEYTPKYGWNGLIPARGDC